MLRATTDARSSFLRLAGIAACVASAVLGQGGGFTLGDVYLHAVAYPPSGALVHINPYTGASQVVVSYTGSPYYSGAAYDPYRDRILTAAVIGGVFKMYAVTAAGAVTDAGVPPLDYTCVAPRGDGIVYYKPFNGPNLRYFDAANVVHDLLDSTGSAAFAFPGGGNGLLGLHRMIYHPGQNALFAGVASIYSPCPVGGNTLHLSIYKFPLSVDGSRVVGPISCSQPVVSPGGGEDPVDLSLTPNGSVFLVVDTNSATPMEPRMLLIDPVTLSASTFASNNSYLGEAAVGAGIFSTAIGSGIILDGFNGDLRVFSYGSSGPGSILTAGIAPGNGGNASMFEIHSAGIGATLWASPATRSLYLGGTQTLDFIPGAAFAGEGYLIGGSLTGWTPGIPYGGYVVPLIYDWYTDYTITNANLGPLFNNFGALSATGTAQAQFVVPPLSPPGLVGLTIFHAAVAFNPGLVLNHVSNPVSLTLVP